MSEEMQPFTIDPNDVVCAHGGAISQVLNMDQPMVAVTMNVHEMTNAEDWGVFHFVMEPDRVIRFATALIDAARQVTSESN